MRALDWVVVAVYLVWIVYDGLRLTKRSKEIDGYFRGNRSLPWWTVGLSVMATQLSAITMIGTTGQGYVNGMTGATVITVIGGPAATAVIPFVVGLLAATVAFSRWETRAV